jgi:hypothetical protein
MTLRGLSRHTRLGFLLIAHDGGPGVPPRRRRRMWLGILTGIVLVAVVACSPAAKHSASPGPSASTPSPSAGKSSTGSSLAKIATGPSACVTAGRPAGGNGPWKFVAPATLCGLPLDNSGQSQQLGQTVAGEDKGIIDLADAGSVTSSTTAEYQSPETPRFYRSVNVVGLTGTFRPAAAVSAVEGTAYTFKKVPPGPHGGAMGCGNEEGTWTCVWATHTTLCTIQIIDTTGELLGASIAVNAVRIRDALEAPA